MKILNFKLLLTSLTVLISSNMISASDQLNSIPLAICAKCIAQVLLSTQSFKDIKTEDTVIYKPQPRITTIILTESKPKKSLSNLTNHPKKYNKVSLKQPKAARQSFARCKRTK